jgi:hypothetical protein
MSETPQPLSEASVPTRVASRYLGQLCQHFQHKIPVTLDEHHGRIEFPSGVCELEAPTGSEALHIRLVGSDPAVLAVLEDVVARHLVRFAFREKLEINWKHAA